MHWHVSWPVSIRLNISVSSSHLSEVLKDVVYDDLLRLIGVHSSERVHVDDSIFKANQRKA